MKYLDDFIKVITQIPGGWGYQRLAEKALCFLQGRRRNTREDQLLGIASEESAVTLRLAGFPESSVWPQCKRMDDGQLGLWMGPKGYCYNFRGVSVYDTHGPLPNL